MHQPPSPNASRITKNRQRRYRVTQEDALAPTTLAERLANNEKIENVDIDNVDIGLRREMLFNQ